MRKTIAVFMIIMTMLAPIGARAAERRDWWPDQVDGNDYYHNLDQIGKWPNDVTSIETMIETVTFRPRVLSAVPYSRTTKITADITTAARLVIVKYTADGKRWEQRSFRNTGYKGPVTAHRKWQLKLHAKTDRYTSWCARQFKQAGVTIDYKKTAMLNGPMAQLYFDDHLIDGIRSMVKCIKVLNIPVRAKQIQIRYVYTGLHGNSYSEWRTIKVR